MAREHAQIKLAIWADDDFRDLTRDEQHLYFALVTHPSLSYAGVVDWRPARIAALASDWTREDVETTAKGLVAKRYIVVDEETEEALVRSFIRNDEILKQPKVALAMLTAYAGVASKVLRGVIVHEIKRLHAESPTLPAFTSTSTASGERLRDLLTKPGIDPSPNPTGNPSGKGSGNPSGTPTPKASGNPSGSPDPYPDPDPSSQDLSRDDAADAATTQDAAEAETSRTRRGRRRSPELPLADDWKALDRHRAKAAELGLDVEHQTIRFRTHAKANDRRQRDWDASFDLWLLKAVDMGGNGGRSAVAVRDDGSIDADAVLGPEKWSLPSSPPGIEPGSQGYAAWARRVWDEHKAEREAKAREVLARRSA